MTLLETSLVIASLSGALVCNTILLAAAALAACRGGWSE
jgi:hypothetical protein